MSTQTIERGADADNLEALEELLSTRKVYSTYSGRVRTEQFTHHMGKGATSYEVRFEWAADPADRMEDWLESGMAWPTVATIKSNKTSQHVITTFDAPKYVQDYVNTMRRALVEHEHARHGVAPISYAAQERWNKHGLKTGAEIRRAEHYVKTIERPGVRRTQAQEIAAEMVHSFIERAEHEDALEDMRYAWNQSEDDLKAKHDADLEEAQQAENKAARRVVDNMAAFFDRLDEPDPFAYAYGATTVEKIKDLARDAMDAIERYDATTN